MNLVPDISGVYRDDLMSLMKRKIVDCGIDAVLLTHAHADHANYISFLNEKIPIYMGETCKLLLQAITERGQSSIENEILEYKSRTDKNAELIKRKIQTFRTGDKFKIGSLEVEPVHVDHSVPGAYGFIIHTSSGTVVYTGDLRLHGTKPEMTRDFVTKAGKEKPIALISEGTRINVFESDESEVKVFNECNANIKKTKKLVLADFSIKDIDRLRTFYQAAKQNKRKLVINIKDIPYLKFLSQDPKLNVPKPDDENILIHLPKQGRYSKSEKSFIELPNVISTEKIGQLKDKVVCAFGFSQFGSLIDIKPETGSLYIHSSSEPYNEEQEFDEKRVNNWLNRFGLNRIQSHCSGHGIGKELGEIVTEINPKKLFPIHTDFPKAYQMFNQNLILVEETKSYNV